MQRVVIISFLVALVVGLSIGYFVFSDTNEVGSNNIAIATTIFPVYDIARNIAPDLKIEQILPNGASPHTYEPTVQDQLKLVDTDVLFMIGLEFDHFAEELVRSVSSGITVVELHTYVDLKQGEVHEHEDEVDHEYAVGYDPHYFTSIEGARSIARVIMETLGTVDPDHRNQYQRNYNRYIADLSALEAESKSKTVDLDNTEIVTFHDGFSYMAEELGLDVVATVEPFPGKEPTIEYLAQLQESIRDLSISTVFREPQLSGKVLDSFVSDLGVTVEELDPLGGGTGRESFIANYSQNVDTIIHALQ